MAMFHSADGTEALDEYTPVHADDDVAPGNPPYWSYCTATHGAPDEDEVAPPKGLPEGQTPARFSLTVPCPSLLVLNRRQYPAWRVMVNGHTVAPDSHERPDGLNTVAIPQGTDTVELHFAQTADRSAGLAISLLAGLFAAGLAFRPKRARGSA